MPTSDNTEHALILADALAPLQQRERKTQDRATADGHRRQQDDVHISQPAARGGPGRRRRRPTRTTRSRHRRRPMTTTRRRRSPQTTLVLHQRCLRPCMLPACAIVSNSPVVLSRLASDGTRRRPCIFADAEVEEEEDASLGRFLCLFYDRATTEDQ